MGDDDAVLVAGGRAPFQRHVVEDDDHAFTAQLQRREREVAPRRLANRASDRGAACEDDLADPGLVRFYRAILSGSILDLEAYSGVTHSI